MADQEGTKRPAPSGGKAAADPAVSTKDAVPSASGPSSAAAASKYPAPAPVADPAPFASHTKPKTAGQAPTSYGTVGASNAAIEAEETVCVFLVFVVCLSSTYTTSLASSVVNYPVEHGRRYHAYQHGRYSRPNDEREMDRLLITHSMLTTAIGGLYQAPVDFDKPQHVLDIGTGNGVWTLEMADQYPNSTFLGNDLSATVPTFVPPNVRFEVDDVESEWLYETPTPFSYVFSRYMAVSIGNWPRLVGNVHAHLAPGGWAEFQDFDLAYYAEDGSLAADNPLRVCIETMNTASRAMGRDPCPGSKLPGWLADAGFQHVVHRRYRIPLGPWAKDPLLKTVGMHNYMQLNQGLEGLTLRLYVQVLKWSEADVLAMCAQIRKTTLHNPRIHPIMDFHVVYGQKPE